MRQFIPVAAISTLIVLTSACSSSTTNDGSAATSAPTTSTASSGPATTSAGPSPAGPSTTGPSSGPTVGPSPSSTGSSAGGASPSDFVARATVLCANAQTELATVFNTGALTQAVFDDGLATLRDVSSQVKALTPPAGHDADAAQLTTHLDQFIADLQQAAPAVIAGDRAGEAAIQPAINADNDAIEAAARALGLRGCLIPAGAAASGSG